MAFAGQSSAHPYSHLAIREWGTGRFVYTLLYLDIPSFGKTLLYGNLSIMYFWIRNVEYGSQEYGGMDSFPKLGK